MRDASVDDLRRQASRAATIVYDRAPDLASLPLTDAHLDDVTVTGRMPARRPDLLRTLLADSHVVDVTISPASLEDVFLDLYSDESP